MAYAVTTQTAGMLVTSLTVGTAARKLGRAAMVLSAGLGGYLAQSLSPRLIFAAATILNLLAAAVACGGLRQVVLGGAPAGHPAAAPAGD